MVDRSPIRQRDSVPRFHQLIRQSGGRLVISKPNSERFRQQNDRPTNSLIRFRDPAPTPRARHRGRHQNGKPRDHRSTISRARMTGSWMEILSTRQRCLWKLDRPQTGGVIFVTSGQAVPIRGGSCHFCLRWPPPLRDDYSAGFAPGRARLAGTETGLFRFLRDPSRTTLPSQAPARRQSGSTACQTLASLRARGLNEAVDWITIPPTLRASNGHTGRIPQLLHHEPARQPHHALASAR